VKFSFIVTLVVHETRECKDILPFATEAAAGGSSVSEAALALFGQVRCLAQQFTGTYGKGEEVFMLDEDFVEGGGIIDDDVIFRETRLGEMTTVIIAKHPYLVGITVNIDD
jgi:hypothetical protein